MASFQLVVLDVNPVPARDWIVIHRLCKVNVSSESADAPGVVAFTVPIFDSRVHSLEKSYLHVREESTIEADRFSCVRKSKDAL